MEHGFVMGLSEDSAVVGGVDVPDRPLEDGELLWASLDSGSDAHMIPTQVDQYGELHPVGHVLRDIQICKLRAFGRLPSRLKTFKVRS